MLFTDGNARQGKHFCCCRHHGVNTGRTGHHYQHNGDGNTVEVRQDLAYIDGKPHQQKQQRIADQGDDIPGLIHRLTFILRNAADAPNTQGHGSSDNGHYAWHVQQMFSNRETAVCQHDRHDQVGTDTGPDTKKELT